jgi:hypothetical protein
VVMDHRIVSRGYGQMLLDSLPPAERVIGPWAQIRAAATEFFAIHGKGVLCSR